MLKSHEKFHSANGKRLVLIADDEFVNREILKSILQDEYELVFAEDGEQTLELMRQHKDELSLVLLDLKMPVVSGMEVLRQAKADPATSQIPIIVVTSDQDAEVESLTIGASDFIPKPYPQVGVILARVLRTIELSEDREIINSTERDELTGLYNREYFYRYVEQFDHYHKEKDMDAIVVDVNHFHMINERFGKAYGDTVLRRIGEALREIVIGAGGMVCRREADTFLVYCPHTDDYAEMLDRASVGLTGQSIDDTRAWLRMGIYASVDKSLDVERRFDRAKMAADTVQGSFTRKIAVYDSTLHERELYAEQLIEDFSAAIRDHQFQVYYQPKFDVRPKQPMLASAEALVRWIHPTLGMISPGVFIPLFEKNGLIQQLDHYVWRETAAQIRDWKERIGFSVPVSVNMSRIDMYDAHLSELLLGMLEENGLETQEFLLEITESAYTQDSEQIIDTVNTLRGLGFQVEMDDFGTGYSSLNMISSLPIDTLKLDMQFIKGAFSEGGDMRMLEVIIDIADYLHVPVIAEGVETEEQMVALKRIGCDYVQGYYFSRPVPADEYEAFLIERRDLDTSGQLDSELENDEALRRRQAAFEDIVHALAADYFSIYYVDLDGGEFVKYSATGQYRQLDVEASGGDFFSQGKNLILQSVDPEDYDMVDTTFTEDNVLSELDAGRSFTLTYRFALEGESPYVHMKATRMENRADKHMVIGISDVDNQVRREREYARVLRMANQDALTGVKSRHAYAEETRKIDAAIASGEQAPLAVVVCDINGLKQVNDTQGHSAGDRHIKRACGIICDVFKHSPVFRIGGDEFIAILRGSDYEARERLMEWLDDGNRQRSEIVDVLIAGGIAEYQPGVDASLAEVFERADAAMYENKKALKDFE